MQKNKKCEGSFYLVDHLLDAEAKWWLRTTGGHITKLKTGPSLFTHTYLLQFMQFHGKLWKLKNVSFPLKELLMILFLDGGVPAKTKSTNLNYCFYYNYTGAQMISTKVL